MEQSSSDESPEENKAAQIGPSQCQAVSATEKHEARCQTYFDEYRDYLKFENNLINNRLLWSLSIQGFLFTAYALAVHALIDPNSGRLPVDILGFSHLVCYIGICVSAVTILSVIGADIAVFKLRSKWLDDIEGECHLRDEKLPGITGGGSACAHFLGHVFPAMIPVLMGECWFYLLKSNTVSRFSLVSFGVLSLLSYSVFAFWHLNKRFRTWRKEKRAWFRTWRKKREQKRVEK